MKMNRRTFLKQSCLGAGVLALSPLSSSLFAAGSDSRPNLLIVMADQLGLNHCGYADYWNGRDYLGAGNAITPNLDAFARQSANFRNAVANTPVCSAFRASLMTGKYTTSHGMVINELRLNPYQECLGHVLTRGGYETAYIGKWHLYANRLGDHYNPDNSFVPRGVHRLGFNGFWAAFNFHHDYYNTYYHTESKEKLLARGCLMNRTVFRPILPWIGCGLSCAAVFPSVCNGTVMWGHRATRGMRVMCRLSTGQNLPTPCFRIRPITNPSTIRTPMAGPDCPTTNEPGWRPGGETIML